jgi:hypothetical protein
MPHVPLTTPGAVFPLNVGGGSYVDSQGRSEVGFGITRLLGFDLLPVVDLAWTGGTGW